MAGPALPPLVQAVWASTAMPWQVAVQALAYVTPSAPHTGVGFMGMASQLQAASRGRQGLLLRLSSWSDAGLAVHLVTARPQAARPAHSSPLAVAAQRLQTSRRDRRAERGARKSLPAQGFPSVPICSKGGLQHARSHSGKQRSAEQHVNRAGVNRGKSRSVLEQRAALAPVPAETDTCHKLLKLNRDKMRRLFALPVRIACTAGMGWQPPPRQSDVVPKCKSGTPSLALVLRE